MVHVFGKIYKQDRCYDRICEKCYNDFKDLNLKFSNDYYLDYKGFMQHMIYKLPVQLWNDLNDDILDRNTVMGMFWCSVCNKGLYNFEFVDDMNCEYCKHELEIQDSTDLPFYDFINFLVPIHE